MNAKELASVLNGREYREEITEDEEKIAKENNLVVIFGYSNYIIEFRGVINDAICAYNGVKCYLDKGKKKIYYPVNWYIDENELNKDFKDIVQSYFDEKCIKIEAQLKDFWQIITTGEYEKFEIMEDGEKFSDGLVIKL